MRDALSAYPSANTQPDAHTADSAFHQAVRAATGNPQIVMLSQDLLARISLGFPVEPRGKGEETHFHQGGEDHKALYEAIAAGERERAEEIARGHFTMSADPIREVLARVRASWTDTGRLRQRDHVHDLGGAAHLYGHPGPGRRGDRGGAAERVAHVDGDPGDTRPARSAARHAVLLAFAMSSGTPIDGANMRAAIRPERVGTE